MVLLQSAMLNTRCTFTASGSSNLAALYLIICTTLNYPIYYGQSLPSLAFSFRCFVDNSTLAPGPILDYLLTLLAHCLVDSTYFICHSWTSVHSLCNSNELSSMAGVYTGCIAISIVI